ncbi:EAL domain-containing protein [Burkholderia vietnamiensis]|uniref:EAL domain-containing protein n=1 Tax=Burkholderia vietnamiensis TaxID=60552 RepID=UPI0007592F49|nr:EAL domain-containing protein [Burkholderia vietnamiensis]KVE96253.1 diguanylate phosphodiesterase [Burkholderia vietnamiensis]KVG11559.1 diguanylate phosphodiesterase [Burkholderia vietnamiensis]MBR7917637.1 EAL domain-containing protein [Burkholderia vietnamiensis]HDR9357748.1 EAL domain-containing protein [Burkholderia vietnamiensis]
MGAGIPHHRDAWTAWAHEVDFPFRAAELEQAIELGEFAIDYQPIVATRSAAVTGAEAMATWHHPRWGVLSQAVSYAIADRLGVSACISEYVVREVCRQLGQWNTQRSGALPISLRLSGARLCADGMPEHLARSVAEFGVAPAQLTLDIPEMPEREESQSLLDTLQRLRRKGFGIVLSDFCAHHTAMSTLLVLPVTGVKFSAPFTARLPQSTTAEAILSSVSRLAHDLRLTLTVSGVDHASQLEFLRKYRHIELQGDALFKPMSAQALVACVNGRGSS